MPECLSFSLILSSFELSIYDVFFSYFTGFIDKNNDLLYKNIKDVSEPGETLR